MHARRMNKKRRGFTLVEVLLVLVIVGMLAAMVVPNLMGRQREANVRATRATISRLETTLDMYAMDHGGQYPDSLEALTQSEDLGGGRRREPYIDRVPNDAWGKPLQYRATSSHGQSKPDIWSTGGPDNVEINNWSD